MKSFLLIPRQSALLNDFPEAAPDESESESSSKRLTVVTELGNFCEKLSRGLESALEGDDGAEVERLAQEVRVRQRLRESQVFTSDGS